MITAWEKQALEGMAGVFSGKAEAADAVREGEWRGFKPRSVS